MGEKPPFTEESWHLLQRKTVPEFILSIGILVFWITVSETSSRKGILHSWIPSLFDDKMGEKSNQTGSCKGLASALRCFRWPTALIRLEASLVSWSLGYGWRKKLPRLLMIIQAHTNFRRVQESTGSFHNSSHPLTTDTLGGKTSLADLALLIYFSQN